MFILFAAAFIVCDLITKSLVVKTMALGQTITVIDGIFDLTYIRNNGSAFSLFEGKQTFLIIVTSLMMAAICVYVFLSREKINVWEKISLGMILGGGIGNLIGRVNVGYVVDFFNIYILPVFNVADIGITVGCILLILITFKSK